MEAEFKCDTRNRRLDNGEIASVGEFVCDAETGRDADSAASMDSGLQIVNHISDHKCARHERLWRRCRIASARPAGHGPVGGRRGQRP